jgi:hypothetical protein
VSLPKDYKDFLRTSNGFGAPGTTSVRLFSIGEVTWLDAVYPDLFQGYDHLKDESGDLHRILLIGDLDGEQQLLLVASSDTQTSAEQGWQCWFFANWNLGEERHSGFRAYMESVLLDLEHD